MSETVRSVERALDVLLCFSGKGTQLGVTEIAEKVDLSKSTVHRLLASLEAKGFVAKNEDRYRLGLRALELAAAYLGGDDLAAEAYSELAALRDATGETASLYIKDGNERVRVQKAEGRQMVRRVVELGQRLPLSVGASGKVLLAWAASEEELDTLSERLKSELAQAKQRGWAASIEEREEGSASVAAPVFDPRGRCVAAVAVSGPASRFSEETIAAYASQVTQAARRIGLRL